MKRFRLGRGFRALIFWVIDRSWLWMKGLVGGERAGVRVEGAGAVEFGDLADVAEVVRGPFVEHLLERDQAELGMLRGTSAYVWRQRPEKLD
jgi:hypothetical protein